MNDRPPPWWKGTRGEWWVAGQSLLLAALIVTPAAWQWSGPSRVVWIATGAGLILTGVALAARAIVELGTSLSPFPRPRRRAVLVQSGLYARVRHPIYGGLIVAALGWALVRGSGVHLLLTGVLAAYLHAKARREEALLLERFPEYEAYRTRTRQMIPWVF